MRTRRKVGKVLSQLACVCIVSMVGFIVFSGFAFAQPVSSDKFVRSAVERALKKMGNKEVEIIAQGSWISGQNYKDPRFQQVLTGASDHDMRVFFRAQNVPPERVLETWKTFRMNVQQELQGFVERGLITAEENGVIRNSINIYPPEELMNGIQSSEEALARFNKWGIYPSLGEVGKEGAGGSYGSLLKFERQGFESGARVKVFYLEGGEVRTGGADLNHMLEGNAPRTPQGLAQAAEGCLEDALHGLQGKSLKDTQKYVARAAERLRKAKEGLRVKLSPNDEALLKLDEKLKALWKKYAAAETRSGLISGKLIPKSPEDIKLQQMITTEFEKLSGELEIVLKESLDDSCLLQRLAQAIEETKPATSSLFRGLLEAADAKWSATASNVRKGMGKFSTAAQKIGLLNAIAAYWAIKDLPEIYVKKGAGEATARFSMSLASLAVPEIALGELVSLIATGIAERAVDFVGYYGYKAAVSKQDCFDLIAGFYTVGGRETQVLEQGMTKCHKIDSLRQLACDIYDKGDLQGDIGRTQKIDPKLVPSEFTTLISCHSKNACRRAEEEGITDKKDEEALTGKCTGKVLTAWMEQRAMVVEEITVLASEIERSDLRLGFNSGAAVIKESAKGATVRVSSEFVPSIKEAVTKIKEKLQCIGGKGSKPFVYQNFTWKRDGVKAGSTTEAANYMEFSFDKKGTYAVCVDGEIEFGVFNTPSTLGPAGTSGKIKKSNCVDVDIGEELTPEKIVATIMGPNKTKAPEKGETGKDISLTVDLKTKRDIKEFSFTWTYEGGYGGGVSPKDNMATIRYDRPGTYTIKVEVYDGSDMWKVKEIKSVKLAEARHTITIEPSLKDAKIGLKVSGPNKVTLGDTITLGAETIAEPRIKAKLKPPVWYVSQGQILLSPDEEDPFSGKQSGQNIGQGASITYKPVTSGEHRFSATVFGEGVSGAAASDSITVYVDCRIVEGPDGRKNQQCELKGEEREEKLTIILMPDRTNVKSGEKININAVAKGGKPPYAFAWKGKVEGDGPSVTFIPSKTDRILNLEVRDGKGQTAKESLTFNVDTLSAPLEGLKDKVIFGTSADARVPVGSDKWILWQSSPNITLSEQETRGGMTTTITFDRMGKVKVWADVRVKKGEVYETTASTDQFEVTVLPLDARIEFDPPAQKIGGSVSAQVKIAQAVNSSTIKYVWLDPPTANREMLADYWIRFTVRDSKPVPIEVELRSTRANETVVNLKRPYDSQGKSPDTPTGPPDDTARKSKRKDAVAGLDKAKIAVSEGRLDEGINLAEGAAKTDPTYTEASDAARKWKTEKDTVTKQLSKVQELIKASRYGDAERELLVAKNLHPKYPPVIDAEKELREKKDTYNRMVAASFEKLSKAKESASKGKLDEAIQQAEEGATIFPGNKEASAYAFKLRKEREIVLAQIGKTRKLISDSLFAEARKELTVAQNLHGNYKPVVETAVALGDASGKYDSVVRESLYSVRSLNEQKEFQAALDKTKRIRETMKLYGSNDEQLRQQENWAKQWQARKERQIGMLKGANEKVRNYDYAGALKAYDEGFADSQNIYNGREPEYKEASRLRDEASRKNKRLGELTGVIASAAENKDPYYDQVYVLTDALKAVDEAITLQPNNEQFKRWREKILARAEKTKKEGERTAAGRRCLDVAGNAERAYLTNESYLQAKKLQWGEKLEEQQQIYLITAIQNYTESLKYLPDTNIEKKIKGLQTTLDGRKKISR